MRLKRTRGLLICFTGIDGSGKTTLARMLVDAMRESGVRITYTWCGWRRFESPLLMPLAWAVKRLLFGRKHDGSNHGLMGGVRNPIYCYLILLDYLFSSLLKVRIPLWLGHNIVSDRYAYDMMAGPLVNYDLARRVVVNLLPKPDLVFLVDLPEEIAYQRKDDVPSIEYLKKQRGVYLEIGKGFGMTVLDGAEQLAELRKTVATEALKLV